MLRPHPLVALFAALIGAAGCENAPTETAAVIGRIPDGWRGFPDSSSQLGLTSEFTHGGRHALSITGRVSANVSQSVLAASYKGQRVRWSGWLKGAGISNGLTSGLWMRIDDGQTTLAFDNMVDRPFIGTQDWTHLTVVLDVPSNAIGITIGVIFNAEGRLIADDFRLESVGPDEAPTKTITPFAFNTAALYANAPSKPVNLDFEGASPASIRETHSIRR